ncbi:MAG TPA: glycoside hydrolase family 15 protein [Gaiellales bacterium]|nr:glycoside hydrolase family 15 protein [Gaiellales bacterium]
MAPEHRREQPSSVGGYLPIEHHGVIGDLHTVALVGNEGTIDWFCPERFDGPSLFGAILDDEAGGRFSIQPVGENFTTKQLYLPGTAVLVTRFFTESGVGEIVDFMPLRDSSCSIVRRIDVVRGSVRFEMRCAPAFDYARAPHRLAVDGLLATFLSGDKMCELRSPTIPLAASGDSAVAGFTLARGERASFVLSVGKPGLMWDEGAVEQAFRDTVEFWRNWIGQSRYRGRWREMVDRSAITLKLLTYLPTGAVVAAPTTSLPEQIGGPRNWDYRYCWLRDSGFTMFAFLRLGFRDEALSYLRWLHASGSGKGGAPLQVMYSIEGRSDLDEQELTHLSGYRDSRPVRIGNGASNQLQLDVYGEVIDAVYLAERGGMPLSYELWVKLRAILDWLAVNWDQPDEGIWEVRGGRRDFTYSRVMTWVAFDRAIRIQTKRGLPADTRLWRTTRDAAYEWVMTHGWSEARQAFHQYRDSDVLDASMLILPLVLMIAPTDPRMLSTLDAIREDLVSDSFVFRYDPEDSADDGLPGREGSFSLCSFWYVECLTRAGRLDEARLVFEKMLGYANHLGLYAEEIGASGEALGNFPQAFTHLGLISAAYDLDRALG